MAHPQISEIKKLFEARNYPGTIELGRKMEHSLKKEPEFHYIMGLAYLKTRIKKSRAIYYLNNAKKLKHTSPDIDFYLGQAYYYNLKLDSAEVLLNEYKTKNGKFAKQADTILQKIAIIQKYINNPIPVLIQNLSKEVNTPYPDYLPYVSPNEDFILFTSRRNTNVGGVVEFDGYYNADVWYARIDKGKIFKAVNVQSINTMFDEEVCGMSSDGSTFYIYVDNVKEKGDIYYVKRIKEYTFTTLTKLPEPINTPYMEYSAFSTSDTSMFFIVSDRPGGLGGKDIWLIKKLPTGEMSLPQCLPPQVNTPLDEDHPFFDTETSTLYFSSTGHENFGGYDLFSSEYDNNNNQWTQAKNLGFPINSPDDEFNISFVEKKNIAYFASSREASSFGDLDIYRVIFTENIKNIAILKIKVLNSLGNPLKDITIKITDNSGKLIGTYKSSPTTNIFTVLIGIGEYNIIVSDAKEDIYLEGIKIDDSMVAAGPLEKIITISK